MNRNHVGIAVIVVCLILDWLVIRHEKARQGRGEITRCVSVGKKLPK